ncbi:MAG: ATP-dependent zinc metalloprotease FtsH [Acidimicrobiales bacterium]|nr:ATP-dependent zinc metalloprotease FtsH [Acidimicrobiales bacterium]
MDEQRPSQAPGPERRGSGRTRGWPRWGVWVVMGLLASVLLFSSMLPSETSESVSYDQFLDDVAAGSVTDVLIDNRSGRIDFHDADGIRFTTTGPLELSADDRALLAGSQAAVEFNTPEPGVLQTWLPLLLPVGLIILFFWWISRRAQGQMGSMMSIGRSRAKTYSSELPGTTFDDVAGYAGVKQEIREVVDFLQAPERFAEIGARVPKGILLVGPPGSGKTLIARAVAGEAGVPFLSVTGSDFMEMFVGVGASRVRDLFESARKMGKAIIFIDEIDSVGRKRGAGLGGGHDEREQTLNQMLSEIDGFESSEGIVMIAATNRPDILDPALLRPGRFDRQVVVPLPELEDRREILAVHVKGKRLDDDVDLSLVARGTPGMSGADLSNLVNEAALTAVRTGNDRIHAEHFEVARDRILMGQKRESMALTDAEKEAIAYHEAGHALCAAVLPTADPLHKVTIIPSGMALGVTMQLPEEERHLYRQDYVEDTLVVRMGGRIAEQMVFGVFSTGASNDLVGATELARKMVREWGMSEQIGPMAWDGQNHVFLGDDLMTSRDYSDETARVIDKEVQRILTQQESRCRDLLAEHRHALDLVARALLEHETIDGAEVARLVELAGSGPVGEPTGIEDDASAPAEPVEDRSPVD